MSDVRVGALLARERLRGPSAPAILGLCVAAVFAVAVLERRSNAASAADDTLTGAVFGVTLPLLAYLLSERLCLGDRLEHSVDAVTRYGTHRRAALFGLLLTSAACMAFASVLLAWVGLIGARPAGLARDLLPCSEIALVSGAAYGLWFGAASRFGKRGAGRKWALILDYLLGTGTSAIAAICPRAHVRNLLGLEPVLGFSQASAWLALGVLGTASLAFGLRRIDD